MRHAWAPSRLLSATRQSRQLRHDLNELIAQVFVTAWGGDEAQADDRPATERLGGRPAAHFCMAG